MAQKHMLAQSLVLVLVQEYLRVLMTMQVTAHKQAQVLALVDKLV
jgi:hypothetical protein